MLCINRDAICGRDLAGKLFLPTPSPPRWSALKSCRFFSIRTAGKIHLPAHSQSPLKRAAADFSRLYVFSTGIHPRASGICNLFFFYNILARPPRWTERAPRIPSSALGEGWPSVARSGWVFFALFLAFSFSGEWDDDFFCITSVILDIFWQKPMKFPPKRWFWSHLCSLLGCKMWSSYPLHIWKRCLMKKQIRTILALLALSLFVLGAGAPAVIGGCIG